MTHISHVVVESTAGLAASARARRHVVPTDEPTSRGGTDTGQTPHELLLSALAACTAITLRMYADRKGWTLGTIRVEVSAVEAEGGGERLERVVSFGEPVDEAQRAKLAEIAEKTPVTKLVRSGIPIATELAPARR